MLSQQLKRANRTQKPRNLAVYCLLFFFIWLTLTNNDYAKFWKKRINKTFPFKLLSHNPVIFQTSWLQFFFNKFSPPLGEFAYFYLQGFWRLFFCWWWWWFVLPPSKYHKTSIKLAVIFFKTFCWLLCE